MPMTGPGILRFKARAVNSPINWQSNSWSDPVIIARASFGLGQLR